MEDIIPTHNKWKYKPSVSSFLPGWLTHIGFMRWKAYSNPYTGLYEDFMTQMTRAGLFYEFS